MYICVTKAKGKEMYELSDKAIDFLKSNIQERMKVAMTMGIGELALNASLRRNNGAKIAANYNAMNMLVDVTGLTIDDLRIELIEQNEQK